jgi:signal transduction protein with GAF and PtsI domain
LEINSQPDIPTLLHAIVQRAAGLLEAQMGALYLVMPDSEMLELVASHNLPGDYVGTRLRLGEGLSGRIAQTGQPMTVSDHRHREGRATVYADEPFQRVLGVPLEVGNRVIGVINVTDDERTGKFDE